jgi:hypothetical protein
VTSTEANQRSNCLTGQIERHINRGGVWIGLVRVSHAQTEVMQGAPRQAQHAAVLLRQPRVALFDVRSVQRICEFNYWSDSKQKSIQDTITKKTQAGNMKIKF